MVDDEAVVLVPCLRLGRRSSVRPRKMERGPSKEINEVKDQGLLGKQHMVARPCECHVAGIAYDILS